jgi:hypothetical protein
MDQAAIASVSVTLPRLQKKTDKLKAYAVTMLSTGHSPGSHHTKSTVVSVEADPLNLPNEWLSDNKFPAEMHLPFLTCPRFALAIIQTELDSAKAVQDCTSGISLHQHYRTSPF